MFVCMCVFPPPWAEGPKTGPMTPKTGQTAPKLGQKPSLGVFG